MFFRFVAMVPVAIAAFTASFLTAGVAQEPGESEIQIKPRAVVTEETNKESLAAKASYILGFNTVRRLSNELKSQGVEVDQEQMLSGMQDFASGKEFPYSEEEVRTVLTAFQKQMEKNQFEKMSKLAEENREAGDKYRAENAAKPGVEKMENGIQYEVLTAGEGALPAATDSVMVDYKGMFTDGTVFDTSLEAKPGRPAQAVPMKVSGEGMIKGFGEVLPKMKVGSKWRVCIPPEFAYQVRGQGPIGPNETLVFEIEVHEIVDAK